MSRLPTATEVAKEVEGNWLIANTDAYLAWCKTVDDALAPEIDMVKLESEKSLLAEPWRPNFAVGVAVPDKLQKDLAMFSYVRQYYRKRGWSFCDLVIVGNRIKSFLVTSDLPK